MSIPSCPKYYGCPVLWCVYIELFFETEHFLGRGVPRCEESRKPSRQDDQKDPAAGEGTSVCAMMRDPGSREGARIFDVGEPQSRFKQFQAGLARLQHLRFSRGALAWRKKNSPARFKGQHSSATGVHWSAFCLESRSTRWRPSTWKFKSGLLPGSQVAGEEAHHTTAPAVGCSGLI